MSASDPSKGFPTGDHVGEGRPAEPPEVSADAAPPGADPASPPEPADSAAQPEAAAWTEPAPGDDPDVAVAAQSGGGASETTGPWRSAVANRPPRATPYEAAGDEAPVPHEQPQASRAAQPGEHAAPADPLRHHGPAQGAFPGGSGQPRGHGPHGPQPGQHPGDAESAAWSGAAAGAASGAADPSAPYGAYPGQDAGAHHTGGWHYGGGHPGGPGGPGYPGGPGHPGGFPPPPHGEGRPGEPPRKPGLLRRNAVVVVAAVTALVTSLIVGPAAAAITAYFVDAGQGGTSALTDGSGGSPSTGDVSTVAEKSLPSVVSIQAGQGTGSGAVISSDGQILTNAHVVSEAQGDTVTVAFNDGSEAKARILGTDPVSDLAVIKAEDQSGLTTAKLGDSDKVEVGADVVAIGSPLGLQGTVTSGVVSSLDRPVNTGATGQQEQQPDNPFGLPEEQEQGQGEQQLRTSTVINAIQTDAPINPGNSGGPLMNMSGEVIGINTAIASTSTTGGQAGSIGLGFAIPINQAKPIAEQLIEDGQASYAAIEATITQSNEEGATVVETNDGGAAAGAGLERGDRITRVNGEEVDGPNALIAAIRAHQPGDTITIGYVRNGEEQEADVTLSAQSSNSLGS
ncbi:trypsin-like peptidase domain-containing protein [Streptomonospora wellingtoniae]|uniref:Trypsin-like peptidase domain-containing protein n=1 Tax=Streptomonospora wellingtoniae TaxID=3075544 RepID=A0ABU2KYL6_9ACTN|nr:trypsin-like peptidase domain-containing protein [Streptomonospora sp. DSM 45055]MDT0304404.1 trypsin-like peptidase domain-containing protein [Streptomonospora sp. DSM 45055]